MKTIIVSVITISSLVPFITSCSKDDIVVPGNVIAVAGTKDESAARSSFRYTTYNSDQVTVGNGKARTFVNISNTDKVLSVGIELTPAALTGLSQSGQQTFKLPVSKKAAALIPFDHVDIVWNVSSNEPSEVNFNQPHFDFVFYTITAAAQSAIPSYASNPSAFNLAPASGYLPDDYTYHGGGQAGIGAQWFQSSASGFGHSMMYGSYNGAVTCWAVCASMQTVSGVSSIWQYFSQPTSFAKQSYYPTRYIIYRDPTTGNYTISFDEMILR